MNGNQGGTIGGVKFDKDNAKEVVTNLFGAPKPTPFDEFRGKWSNKWQYLLAILGHSISLRTMFLMTYIYTNHGGWAIIIPLILMLPFFYNPTSFMEMLLGHFSSRSYPYILHTLAPPFGGISNVMSSLNFFSFIFYTIVAAYPLVHIFDLIGYTAPWDTSVPNSSGASNFYFVNSALGLFTHYEDSSFRVPLMITVPFLLLIIGIFLYYGHRIIKYAVYATATLPIILIVIVAIKGHFPAVRDEMFKPFSADFSMIGKPAAWFWCCVLVVHLLGQGHGINTVMASYFDFRDTFPRGSALVPVISIFVNMSIVPVFCEFAAYLHHNGVSADLLKSGGFNLLFLKYADFLEAAHISKFWAALFYLAIFLFEFHSLILQGFVLVGLTADAAAMKNDDSKQTRSGRIINLVVFLIIVAALAIGGASKGVYPPCDQLFWFALIFQMLIYIGEFLAVGWYYNFKRIGKDAMFLYGNKFYVGPILFAFIGLLCYIVILIMLIVKGMPFAPKQYWVLSYGLVVGYLVFALVVMVLLVMIIQLYRKGIKRDELFKFSVERRPGWEPADPQHRMEYEGFIMNQETVASA